MSLTLIFPSPTAFHTLETSDLGAFNLSLTGTDLRPARPGCRWISGFMALNPLTDPPDAHARLTQSPLNP